MKKMSKLTLLILLALLMSTLFIGCGNNGVESLDLEEADNGENESLDRETDVVIIGSGGGGLAAALEAKNAGKQVIVVEKMPMVGGNTLRATGGMNAAGTSSQEAMGIEDSIETHYQDTIIGGYEKNDPELVKTMTENAPAAVEWLIGMGADLNDVGRLGGATNNRAHRPTGGAPVGAHIIEVLKKNVEETDIEILLETVATEIIYEDKAVKGIKARDLDGNEITIESKTVIIASGGFGANASMVTELDSSLEGFGTTNHQGATGDGVEMASAIEAETIQMEEIQTHPTVVPGIGYMITEAVRGNGAILINREGNRFIDEMGTRDVVSEAILAQEKQTAFLFFDETVKESLSAIDGYIKMGLTIEADSIEELAEELGVNAENLNKTTETYNAYVDAKEDAEFSRADMPVKLEKPKFYAIEIGPAVHHTMGGIKINSKAQVINVNGDVIPGLYAAGEVTGGVHGGNRLGGNALADIIVFGRIAGKNSADFIK